MFASARSTFNLHAMICLNSGIFTSLAALDCKESLHISNTIQIIFAVKTRIQEILLVVQKSFILVIRDAPEVFQQLFQRFAMTKA
jgi:hypothetical protein